MQRPSTDDTSASGKSGDCTARLAGALSPWRQVLVRADAILHWERPLGLACLLAGLTLAFALLALCRPSPLSALALVCLLAAITDMALPRVLPMLLGDAWSEADQACFVAICRRIVARWDAASAAVSRAARLRRDRPHAFAAVAGAGLLATALLGVCVSGLFLAYTAALAAALWPGVSRHGLLHRAVADIRFYANAKLFGKTA